MQSIIENIVDSRVKNLLEIINYHFPDKFDKKLDGEFNKFLDSTTCESTASPSQTQTPLVSQTPSPKQ